MKCPTCKQAELSREEGPHTYDAEGVRVVLVNAVTRVCPHCGERLLGLQRANQLTALIVRLLALKVPPLMPAEARYLRTVLGWSGAETARQLHVSSETVSRWENGKQPIGAQAELLLRLAAYVSEPSAQYNKAPFPSAKLSSIAVGEPQPQHLRLRYRKGPGWAVEQRSVDIVAADALADAQPGA